MQIRKAANVLSVGNPTQEQLANINRQAKSPLSAEEVYVFAVRLCDDRPDRDYERLSKQALEQLAPMFVGKTGILDHDWRAENQMGRIFDAQVVTEGSVSWLKAWVYMLRSEKTEPIIREIEGGIKKEVSVGCAMGRTVCSVCGEDYGLCEHRKGEIYGTEVCTAILCEPVDAYEFSFVAVPAQKEAGVVKRAKKADAKTAALLQEAKDGRMFKAMLQQDVVKMGLLLDLGLEEDLWRKLAMALDTEELRQVRQAFSRKAAELFPPVTQLGAGFRQEQKPDSAFLI